MRIIVGRCSEIGRNMSCREATVLVAADWEKDQEGEGRGGARIRVAGVDGVDGGLWIEERESTY